MIMLKVFLLMHGLLLATRCDILPRHQDMKDGEEEHLKKHQHQGERDHGDPYGHFATGQRHSAEAQRETSDISATVLSPLEQGHVNPSHRHPSEDLSVNAGSGSADSNRNNTPIRLGNWCAFVQKRVVTMAVSCGTEKYVIKSQSPCPNGNPECPIVMYKLSTRPVYREKQKVFTMLQWKCCPGHGGNKCRDNVETSHVSAALFSSTDIRLHPGGLEINSTGSGTHSHHQNQEQNDHQEANRSLFEPLISEGNSMEDPYSHDYTPSQGTGHRPHYEQDGSETHSHQQNWEKKDHQETKRSLYEPVSSEGNPVEDQHSNDYTTSPDTGHRAHYEQGAPNGVDDRHRGPPSETHYASSGLVPIHYLKDVMMSHLQPIIDSFNLTLARLSEEVQDLQRDMTHIQLQQMLQGESEAEEGGIGQQLEQNEAMTDTSQQLDDLNIQLGLQRDEMEMRLHVQQTMMHYNLTNLKRDVDVQIKHNQKILQTSLHSLNSSISDARQKQEQMMEELQRVLSFASQIPSPDRNPPENTAVWEAITRLDNKVVNNSVWLTTQNEHQIETLRKIEQLQKGWKILEEHIAQNDRRNEDRYIEAFLEVDAAKATVGKYADDLSKNVSVLQSTVQELEEDTNYLYAQFYKNISSGSRDCDCTSLWTSVAHLKQVVANISVIASENRLALDSAAEEKVNIWETGGWGPPVEDLKLSLYTMQSALVLEKEMNRKTQQTLTTLQTSVLGSQNDIEVLQQQDIHKSEEIKRLADSFESLLDDGIRHNDVLEILLDRAVSDFLEQSPQYKKDHSIHALKMVTADLQEQVNRHSRSLASMLNSEDPTAVEPSTELADWITEDHSRRPKEQRFGHFSEEPTRLTAQDFFTLEKTVKRLQDHVVKLGEQQCGSCAASKNAEEKLRAELTSVHKNLDDHLRMFGSVFSNLESLTESEATVDLDKLSALLKEKDAKLEKKRHKKKVDIGEQHDKRDTSLKTSVRSQPPEKMVVFVASSSKGVNTPGAIVFETTSLNHGEIYSPETGVVRAPSAGVYLFVFTLDFRPGPSLAQLKRGETVVASLHQSMKKPSGPTTRVCLLQLQQGEEVHLELVQGTLEQGKPQENIFSGLLLLQTR